MRDRLTVGLVQMCSATDHATNITAVREAVVEAAGQGAELVALPEVAGLMNRDATAAREVVRVPEEDPFTLACQEIAADHDIWLHTGSSPMLAPDGRFLNQSALIDPEGRVVARYTKIHLFDVELAGQKPIKESKRFAPGEEAVLVETPWGGWGLTICYDLRFPGLYRDLAVAGARILFVPSAFTVPTGQAHWHVLLRARAIETGAFVLAAAQSGHHTDGRRTYGHSLAVDPWGEVLTDMGEKPGVAVTTLDLTRVATARAQIPALQHARPYGLRVMKG